MSETRASKGLGLGSLWPARQRLQHHLIQQKMLQKSQAQSLQAA